MRWSMGSVADSVVANLTNKKSIPKNFCKIYTNNKLRVIEFIPHAKIFFLIILPPPAREKEMQLPAREKGCLFRPDYLVAPFCAGIGYLFLRWKREMQPPAREKGCLFRPDCLVAPFCAGIGYLFCAGKCHLLHNVVCLAQLCAEISQKLHKVVCLA